jgi:hypothetical protein
MNRLVVIAFLLAWSGVCLAQGSKGELQGVYLRIQDFNFNSGSPSFNIENAKINGGGYGFVYHITKAFGFYQQMGFMEGVEQNGFKMRLVTELQGMQLGANLGPLVLYIKGGLGFARYVFSGTLEGADYGFAANYGGGTQIRVKRGLYLLFEATRLDLSLPNLTNAPGRSTWDHPWQFATGIAIHY